MKIPFRLKTTLAVFAFAAIFQAVYALDDVGSGYKLNKAETKTITAHGVCNSVTNNSQKDYFIPTKTAAEWQSFKQAASSRLTGVALADCCTPQASAICVGGNSYWVDSCGVQGTIKQNCNGNGCRNGVCGSDLPPPPPAPSSPF